MFGGNIFQYLTILTVEKISCHLIRISHVPANVSWACKKSLLPTFLYPPYQVHKCNNMSPEPSHLKTEKIYLSSPLSVCQKLQCPDHLNGPPLDLLQYVNDSCNVELQSEHSTPDAVTQLWNREEKTLPLTCWLNYCQCSPSMSLVTFYTRANCRIPKVTRSFFAKLHSILLAPSVYCRTGSFSHRWRTLHMP